MTIMGDEIKYARQHKGMTMRQVHNGGGPSLTYQSDVERGKLEGVSVRCFFRWAEAIGVDPVELLDVIYQRMYEERGSVST